MFPEWGLWHVGMGAGFNVTAAPYCGWFPSLGKDAPYSSSIYLAWWIKGKWLFLCLSTKVWPDHWVKIEIFLRSKPFLGWPGTSWPFRPPVGCPCSCVHGPFRSLDSLKQSEWPRMLQSLLFCPPLPCDDTELTGNPGQSHFQLKWLLQLHSCSPCGVT